MVMAVSMWRALAPVSDSDFGNERTARGNNPQDPVIIRRFLLSAVGSECVCRHSIIF